MNGLAQAGNYNSGFWVANRSAIPFLRWWTEQTFLFSQMDTENGYMAEQGWLRFVLDFDPKARIFRHPGYNVAYWNICDRKVEKSGDGYLIDGEELKLMHFSGFAGMDDPAKMSVHQDRFILGEGDPRLEIFREYREKVRATEAV